MGFPECSWKDYISILVAYTVYLHLQVSKSLVELPVTSGEPSKPVLAPVTQKSSPELLRQPSPGGEEGTKETVKTEVGLRYVDTNLALDLQTVAIGSTCEGGVVKRDTSAQPHLGCHRRHSSQ